MALATRCPYCQTTFRVAQDQLKLRAGIVRCGACKQVFNGIEHLLRQDDAPAKPASPPVMSPSADQPLSPDPAAKSIPATDIQSVPSANTPVPQESAAAFSAVREEFFAPADLTPADSAPSTIPQESDDPTIPADLLPDFTPAAPLSPSRESGDFSHEVDFDLSGVERPPEDVVPEAHAPEPPSHDAVEEAAPVSAEAAAHVQPLQAQDSEAPLHETDQVERPHSLAAEPPHTQAELLQPPFASAFFDEEDNEVVAISHTEEPSFVTRGRRRQRWKKIAPLLLGLGSLILLVTLVLHGAYLFRTQLGARFPELKPALAQFCALAQCEPVLAKQIDAISLESSELQAVVANKNNFSLSLLLRNRSSLQQAWPNLELTLNDANEQALLRRVFEPREYLPSSVDVTRGFAPDSEQPVKLYFTLTELKASGYRVFLFYP